MLYKLVSRLIGVCVFYAPASVGAFFMSVIGDGDFLINYDALSAYAGAVAAVISAIVAMRSAGIAAKALANTEKYQQETKENERKYGTIRAFGKLQTEVLDKLVLCTKKEIENVVENIDEKECKEAYNGYRALIAKCEHFAVAVNNGIYDYEVFKKLGGQHIMFLYEKVEPVIIKARKNCHNDSHYQAFEELYNRLKNEK